MGPFEKYLNDEVEPSQMVSAFLIINVQRPHRDPKHFPQGRSKMLLVIFPKLNLGIFLKSSLPSNEMNAKNNIDSVFPT